MPTTTKHRPVKKSSRPVARSKAAAKPAAKTAAARAKPKAAPPAKPLTEPEIMSKLARLDPSWGPAAANRFARDVEQGKSAAPRLVAALDNADPAVRSDAATACADVGATEAVAKLKALLGDPVEAVRTAAAQSLLRLGDRAFFAELIKSLKDAAPKVVCGAATALGLSANKEAVPYLIEAYQTHDPAIGSAVATALGRLGDARAISHLQAALRANLAPAEAAEALGRIGDPNSMVLLIRALGLPDENTRANAARALGMIKLGGGQRDIEMREKTVIPALRLALEDQGVKVRVCAALSLFELGDKGAGTHLVQALHSA